MFRRLAAHAAFVPSAVPRGRQSPDRAAPKHRINDVVDFWRVEDITDQQRLLLRAEMKLPGWAWLEFSIDRNEDQTNTLSVRAYYQPSGFWGKVYWYACYPFHSMIFQDLIEQIERRSRDTEHNL